MTKYYKVLIDGRSCHGGELIRDGKLSASAGDAVASQSREILRTVNTQLKIYAQAQKGVTAGLVTFAGE